jgi:hydrogenase large subunit
MVDENLNVSEFNPGKITEDITHSWYEDASTGKHPQKGETKPEPGKERGYSFIKSPRYDGEVYEVGPLARMVLGYVKGRESIKTIIDRVLGEFDASPEVLFSVLGRHAARAVECKIVADAMADWVLGLKPGEPVMVEYDVPEESEGVGLTTAPRGSLGHWISVKDGKINRYQVITPTAWNASPKDDSGKSGPVEQSLVGTKVRDRDNPFEVVRIVRSYDPCLACSIHVVSTKHVTRGVFRVV